MKLRLQFPACPGFYPKHDHESPLNALGKSFPQAIWIIFVLSFHQLFEPGPCAFPAPDPVLGAPVPYQHMPSGTPLIPLLLLGVQIAGNIAADGRQGIRHIFHLFPHNEYTVAGAGRTPHHILG